MVILTWLLGLSHPGESRSAAGTVVGEASGLYTTRRACRLCEPAVTYINTPHALNVTLKPTSWLSHSKFSIGCQPLSSILLHHLLFRAIKCTGLLFAELTFPNIKISNPRAGDHDALELLRNAFARSGLGAGRLAAVQ